MMSDLKVQSVEKVLLIGDSITDAGRRADAAPYGRGYVSMIVNLVTARHPGRDITFVNRGIGGNTVRNLAARWQEDVIAEKPDWLSVMIGINDVHRCFRDTPEAVDPDEYRETYTRLLEQAAAECAPKMILMEPFYLCSDPDHDINRMLLPYFDTVHALAEQFDAILVETHKAFQQALTERDDRKWSEDNVHPFPEGHAFIALQWLAAMGWSL